MHRCHLFSFVFNIRNEDMLNVQLQHSKVKEYMEWKRLYRVSCGVERKIVEPRIYFRRKFLRDWWEIMNSFIAQFSRNFISNYFRKTLFSKLRHFVCLFSVMFCLHVFMHTLITIIKCQIQQCLLKAWSFKKKKSSKKGYFSLYFG